MQAFQSGHIFCPSAPELFSRLPFIIDASPLNFKAFRKALKPLLLAPDMYLSPLGPEGDQPSGPEFLFSCFIARHGQAYSVTSGK